MTFDRAEELKGQLTTLDCAFIEFRKMQYRNRLNGLMMRLSLDYDTDKYIEHDCIVFIDAHSKLLRQFKDKHYK